MLLGHGLHREQQRNKHKPPWKGVLKITGRGLWGRFVAVSEKGLSIAHSLPNWEKGASGIRGTHTYLPAQRT